MNYAKPELATVCPCRDRGGIISPTFCMSGHLLECHYPLDCRQAACSHLTRYEEDLDQAAMARLEEMALATLASLADPDCPACGGAGRTDVHEDLPVPEGLRETFGDTFQTTRQSVCACVAGEPWPHARPLAGGQP